MFLGKGFEGWLGQSWRRLSSHRFSTSADDLRYHVCCLFWGSTEMEEVVFLTLPIIFTSYIQKVTAVLLERPR